MNERRTDFELLRDFARNGDQRAFTLVVRNHLDLVYGTAMRKAADQGSAEEITQNVFAALARKAWQFAPDDSLAAWLHRATLLEAKEWIRGELRRRRREETAADLGTTMNTPDDQPALRALVPLLDEALLSLHERDRTALLLRYYDAQPLREVGASLGVGEDAAQKRVASALGKLVNFFQRRGFKTVTGAMTAAALQQTATSAPAIVAASVVQAAAQLTPPTLLGFAGLLSRFAGVTRLEAASVCVAIAFTPCVWQWNKAHAIAKEANSIQLKLEATRAREEQLSAEIDRQRAESARLGVAVANEAIAQLRNEEAARQADASAARIRALLTDANYRWPEDLPYVRIPKAVVKQLELQGVFSWSGAISEVALELYGITPEEKIGSERALGNYWTGVQSLMAANAYETNATGVKPGRLAKTVFVPPLGQDLKTLAHETRTQLNDSLGDERAKMIFGGWEDGAIQIFWPGNLWKISEEPQKFTVWIDVASGPADRASYGASWNSTLGGISSGVDSSLHSFPRAIATQFFTPWLAQFGITNSMYPQP
jgi:RNA polymerase sigma-70 factor (ECF subfamily)